MTTNNKDNNFIDELREDLSGICLTTDEKQFIRTNLEDELSEPDTADESVWLHPYLRKLQQLPHMLTKTAVGAAAILFLFGGLTYAAEDALPGTSLYAVKTHVNEAFINMTAVSNSKTAATQSKLAARRINELQALVNSGSLTTTTSEKLLNEIAAHTKTARQNIANLESASEKKRRQAIELRSQLTALLAAESETLESVTTSTASTSSEKNKLAQQAARKLIAIADEGPGATTSVEGEKLTQSALTNLLELAVDRLDGIYNQYKNDHDPKQTPPPQKLVTLAHDLDKALTQIKEAKHLPAVTHLKSLLVQLDDMQDTSSSTATTAEAIANHTPASSSSVSDHSASGTVSSISAKKGDELAVRESASSTQETQVTTSNSATATDQQNKPDVASSIPSKQNLHNQTIREIIAKTRSYLEEAREKSDKRQQTQATTSDSAAEATSTQATSSATSSAASSTQQKTANGTSSTSTTASSSGPQQGDESRL